MTFELLRIRIWGFNRFSICEKAESACSRHKLTGSPLYALAFPTFCKKDCSVVILSFHSAKKCGTRNCLYSFHRMPSWFEFSASPRHPTPPEPLSIQLYLISFL